MSQSLRGSTVTNYFKFSLAGTSTIVLYSFKSPWASLCPCANTCCVRGVASARPRRASKRLDCRLWKRDLFHQHNRKGKIVMIETSRYKGLVFWVRFWHLKLIWFLETELGPPLFEALIANAVFLCDADALLHWNSAAEEGAWGGLKTGPPRRHQIQPVEGPVLDPRAKETYLKRGQKVDPLEIKSGPPWRVQFWPLHCGKSVEAFISSWSWFDQQQLRLESWTVRGPYCQRGVFVWRWCASTLESAAEEGAWGGLKTGPPRRHQIQPVEGPVLDPRAKETYLKRGQKVDPLDNQIVKSPWAWRVPVLAPAIVSKRLVEALWKRDLFHQHNRKLKQVQGIWVRPEAWQRLRLESWTVRGPYCQRGVFVWRWCASTLEQRSWRRCLGWA